MPYLKSTIAMLWLVLVAVRGTVAAVAGTETFDPPWVRDRPAARDWSSPAAPLRRIDPAALAQADAANGVDGSSRGTAGEHEQQPGVWALLLTGAFGATAIMRRRALPLTDQRIGRTRPPL
jgi:hypothetical protein